MIVNKWVILGAIVVAILLVGYGMLGLSGFTYQKATTGQATAFLTVIPAGPIPTVVDSSSLFITPTATVDPSLGDLGGIQVNAYVQISGTGGDGLNIRESPGKNTKALFVAAESEVFLVIGGPVNQDDIIWWQLSTPYDASRQGWAAADYLVLIKD
jgi:hypothetical protein